MGVSCRVALLLASLAGTSAAQVQSLSANGVELRFSDRGSGIPVVFIHGGGGNMHEWDGVAPAFSTKYRVITYSRRYAEPGLNRDLVPDYSAKVDARDLAALLDELQVHKAHVIGFSIGASVALFLAADRPDLVRSLVLAEPPMRRLAGDTPAGAPLYRAFMTNVYEPTSRAFKAGQPERAMRTWIDYYLDPHGPQLQLAGRPFPRKWDELPAPARAQTLSNPREMMALTTSTDVFPVLDRAQLKALQVPVLMFTGEQTAPLHRAVDDEVAKQLSDVKRVMVPKSNHFVWLFQPQLLTETTLKYLSWH